jgi:hypothetical protein
MSVDLQVVFPQETVPIDNVEVVNMGGVWVVNVRGQDFTAVDEVLINDNPAPNIIVYNANNLTAQLPDFLQSTLDVKGVSVLSKRFTMTAFSLLRFKLTQTPGKVRGLVKLVQTYFKLLLTTPGTDIFAQNMGGGLLRIIGKNFNGSAQGQNLVGDAVIAVSSTSRQLMTIQAQNSGIPRDERLLAASVTGSSFDVSTGSLFLEMNIQSQAGRSATANMQV